MSEIENRWKKQIDIQKEEKLLEQFKQDLRFAEKNPQLLMRKGLLRDLAKSTLKISDEELRPEDLTEIIHMVIVLQEMHIRNLRESRVF